MKLKVVRGSSTVEILKRIPNDGMRFSPFFVSDVDTANDENWLFSILEVGPSAASFIDIKKCIPPAL